MTDGLAAGELRGGDALVAMFLDGCGTARRRNVALPPLW
jgi:hypothetical protein